MAGDVKLNRRMLHSRGDRDVGGLLPCYVLSTCVTPDGLRHSEAMGGGGVGESQAKILAMRIRDTLCLNFGESSF